MTAAEFPRVKVRRWFVTAAARTVKLMPSGADDVPYGVGHIRQVGDAYTACGIPALNWPIFWDLSDDDPVELCLE